MSHNYMQVLITELIQIVMIRHTIILFVMSDLEFTMETDTQWVIKDNNNGSTLTHLFGLIPSCGAKSPKTTRLASMVGFTFSMDVIKYS